MRSFQGHQVLISCRLPSLGDEARTQAVLSHASVVLVPSTHHSASKTREASQGLLRTRGAPLRDSLASRVSSLHQHVRAQDLTLRSYRWSYLINLTLIGNAVYLSMDLPDTFLAVST